MTRKRKINLRKEMNKSTGIIIISTIILKRYMIFDNQNLINAHVLGNFLQSQLLANIENGSLKSLILSIYRTKQIFIAAKISYTFQGK